MKKKGFTLIELLAVIVILAIIALIATPLVLKYIETARKDSFKNSIEAVERSVELKILEMQTKGNIQYPLEIDVKDLDLKNKDKLNGTVIVEKQSSDKNIYTYDVTDNDYKIYGTKESEIYKLDKTVKLKLKTGNGIIDDDNNLVYSFYDEGQDREGYEEIDLENYFEAENGTLEFQKTDFYNTDATGAKIILKDKNNKVIKTYTVVIFCDVDGSGLPDGDDMSFIDLYIHGKHIFNKAQLKAADVNLDGKIDEVDIKVIDEYSSWICNYNQITNVCTEYNY